MFGFDRSFFDVWQFDFENRGAKFWRDLYQDETFNCYLAKRWFELIEANQTFNYLTISNLIDSYVALLSESQERELQRWPPQEDWPTRCRSSPKHLRDERLDTRENKLDEYQYWFFCKLYGCSCSRFSD